ncbi:nitronate monooxygenase family protein [Acidimicrobiia bacterium EGI L10123]|uniref:NAD(P)H-dependent flavin oxidoreductase n=1 Tax=Salinilacustrithrix flava TaxID=2957203 RepID=UPI003D7C26E7|nr:nitronate monooxygenase family protein [Acidimicrobiia bacterium EGI L10123]
MRTAVTERLGIEFPILAFSHCRDVVAAVTNSGGMGVLGAVAHSPKQLEIDLDWIAAETKGKPFGVDLLIPQKFVGADDGGLEVGSLRDLIPAEHREWLDGLLAQNGIPPLPEDDAEAVRSYGGMRVDPKSMAPLVDISFAKGVSLMASALGPPPPWLIERAKAEGEVPVAALAGSLEHAIRHDQAGADLIIAQGTEAGGHTGEVATMVLVPEVVDAVQAPVLAAGGIGRGRQIAASLALGAEGVWCGSVWLTTQEAETSDVIKDKFLAAPSSGTVRSRSLTGKPARMIRTDWTDAWESEPSPGPLGMPLQSLLVAEAQSRIARVAAKDEGARRLSTYFVGQIVGSMNTVQPAARVVLDMVEEFIDAVERLDGLLQD